jgi:putative transcriptional regulator
MDIDMATGTVRLRVPELLDERNMSTAEFAEKAGLTYNQALSIRRGVYTRIDLTTLARICEALGVEPGDVFEFKKDSGTT